MVSAALFISLFLFWFLNVPVGIAIGMSAVVAILAGGTLSLGFVTQALVNGIDSFPIMAIPLFILAGELMGQGGVSRRLLNVCNVFFGRVSGGLAIVTVAMCMMFSAVSGSSPATVAAVGSMVVPTMLERGYSKSFTLALIACAGTLGIIFPPSIPMVIYGAATGTSISTMFMAGFLPGMFISIVLMFFCYFYCKKKGFHGDDTEPFTWKRAWSAIWDAKWALINPVIILGGIYGGFFTPTEAAAVAVVYAFICGVFIHREMGGKKIIATLGNACSTTGTTLVILGCATAFAQILTIEQIPQMLTVAISNISDNRIVILLVINLFLLIVGLFMDPTPAMLILSPILLPVALSFGLHPVHFGIIMVVNLAIGFFTPPIGVNLFVASRIGNEGIETISRGIVPFVLVMFVCLMLITYVPQIAMILPSILGGR